MAMTSDKGAVLQVEKCAALGRTLFVPTDRIYRNCMGDQWSPSAFHILLQLCSSPLKFYMEGCANGGVQYSAAARGICG